MTKTPSINFTNFNRGIINVSRADEPGKSKLPQLVPFAPSDAKIETKLTDLWQAKSLENMMHETFIPQIKDLKNLNPSEYQKRLKEAKGEFLKKVKERQQGGQKKKKKRSKWEQDEEEILQAVIKDLEELENHQELLWMLRQVVHLA